MTLPKGSPRWKSAGTGLAVGALLALLAKELHLHTLISYWGDRAPWIAAISLACAALWMTRLRWLVATATAGLGLMWLMICFTPLTRWMARDLPRRDPIQEADAVFVLGAGIQKDGDLNYESMSRFVHALELLGRDLAPQLIVSELPHRPSYAKTARKLMNNIGLKQEVVPIGLVGNTRDEAVKVGELCRERGWSRLLVVTSPSHSKRASAALEHEGVEVISSPSTQTSFDFETLDQGDGRLEAWGKLIHERLGWWIYKTRGWLSEPQR